jgi:hypothetical protein
LSCCLGRCCNHFIHRGCSNSEAGVPLPNRMCPRDSSTASLELSYRTMLKPGTCMRGDVTTSCLATSTPSSCSPLRPPLACTFCLLSPLCDVVVILSPLHQSTSTLTCPLLPPCGLVEVSSSSCSACKLPCPPSPLMHWLSSFTSLL